MADPEMTDPQKGAEPEYKVERPKPKMTRQQRLGMGALLAGASLAALWTVWPSSRTIPDVETSAVEEFQDQAGGSPFGAIEPKPEAKPAGDGFSDIEGELASQREDLEARNATLQSEVERLQRELGDLADRADAEKGQTAKELALALEEAQSQNLALMEDMRRQFDQEIAVLKASADTAGAAVAQREAELAAKRAEREAQLAARVASPSVVFDDGQKGGAGDARMGMPEAPAEGRDATGRDFVQSGREATTTEVSQVIANPSNTVLRSGPDPDPRRRAPLRRLFLGRGHRPRPHSCRLDAARHSGWAVRADGGFRWGRPGSLRHYRQGQHALRCQVRVGCAHFPSRGRSRCRRREIH
jgi:type IV secretion system protein VirB10